MAKEDKPATMGDVIVAAHKGVGAFAGSDDGTVEILGMIVDGMTSWGQHTQDMLNGFYEDARDELDIIQRRVRRILALAPRLGSAREYEDILAFIEGATYVSPTALDAYRASSEFDRNLSMRLPADWVRGSP